MNKMKTKRIMALMLSLTLCLTMMIPAPILAANDNGKKDTDSVIPRPYVEGEVIVCYIDPEDVDEDALDEEIKDPGSTDEETQGGIGVNGLEIKPTDAEIQENLNLLDMVEQSDSLMELGDKPIKKMKGVKKGIIKKNKADKGKAKANLGLVKNKNKKYNTEELVEKISELPNVDYAQPNYIYETTDTKPTWNLQWAYDTARYSGKTPSDYGMNIPNWNVPENRNAEGTVVAVLDTGVDYNHEDLRDVMWDDGDKYPALTTLHGGKHGYNAAGNNSDPMDIGSHGTHCAGIIGAAWNGKGVSGAANGVEIMAVRAAYDATHLSDDHLIAGMTYIKTAKDNGVNVVAVNNSWGTSVPYEQDFNSLALEHAITSLGESNVLCIFSAGNEAADCDVHYDDNNPYVYTNNEGQPDPCTGYWQSYYYHQLKNVIVIGSNGPTGEPASYSNYGANTVDIFAPGGDFEKGQDYTGEIASTVPNNEYAYMQGTSMACPAAVGAVAILKAQNPNATMDNIRDALKITAKKDDSKVNDKCIAGGYIDVAAALNYLGHEHKYTSATCTRAAMCLVCGAEYGEPTQHNWSNNVCEYCNAVQGGNITNASIIADPDVVGVLNSKLPKAMQDSPATVKYVEYSGQSQIVQKTTVVIPYESFSSPAITDPSLYNFAVTHLVTQNIDEEPVKVAESLPCRATEVGLEVTVTNPLDFAIAYRPIMGGDLDGDYTITAKDLDYLCRSLVTNTLAGDKLKKLAKMDNNNAVDVGDAILIRREMH